MKGNNTENLQFPIGKYTPPKVITTDFIQYAIAQIEQLPAKIKRVVDQMSEDQFDNTYRPGAWTARQVLYHIGDSHLHSYVRFKWALTEDSPTIKAYDQDGWGGLFDSTGSSVNSSMKFIEVLHERWVSLLKGIDEPGWEKTFYHPQMERHIALKWNAGLYAWHGNHHLAHLEIIADNR
ncbi:MAG: putative metal-dependent hydrolase [Cyclobacteriaceae bacterium]|nr:putative metal-dependent hydrolase [Cyclobacteriaceae bacterium]